MTLHFLTLEAEWPETQFTLIMMEVGEQVRLEDNMFDLEPSLLQVSAGCHPDGVSRWLEICVWSSGELSGPKTQIWGS